jgi:hypothetical protein
MRARENNKHHLNIAKDDNIHKTLSRYSSDAGLRTALSWTGGDALKLAKSVLDKLKAGDPLKALELVRLSEKLPSADGKKGIDSIVSWNHIMDYFMVKHLTREAFKTFNEVGVARFRGSASSRLCGIHGISLLIHHSLLLDEEARTQTRRTYLYHYATRFHHESQEPKCGRGCDQGLRFHVPTGK